MYWTYFVLRSSLVFKTVPVDSITNLIVIKWVELLVLTSTASIELKAIVFISFKALSTLGVLNLIFLFNIFNLVSSIICFERFDNGATIRKCWKGETGVGEGSDGLRVAIPQVVLTSLAFLLRFKFELELVGINEVPLREWNGIVSNCFLTFHFWDQPELFTFLEASVEVWYCWLGFFGWWINVGWLSSCKSCGVSEILVMCGQSSSLVILHIVDILYSGSLGFVQSQWCFLFFCNWSYFGLWDLSSCNFGSFLKQNRSIVISIKNWCLNWLRVSNGVL